MGWAPDAADRLLGGGPAFALDPMGVDERSDETGEADVHYEGGLH